MATSHPATDDGTGHCRACTRRLADYGWGPRHARGRIPGISPGIVYTRDRLARMTTDECIAAGYCECGVKLDVHEPLPKWPKLSSGVGERNARTLGRPEVPR